MQEGDVQENYLSSFSPVMTRRRFAIGGLAACSIGCYSQPRAVPSYMVGDHWVMRGQSNGRTYEDPETIEAIATNALMVKTIRSGLIVTVPYSPSMNKLDMDGKEIEQVRHPLFIGQRWDYAFRVDLPKLSARTDNTRSAKVTGMERIRVSAGEFDCFKIEVDGFWTNTLDPGPFGGNGHFRETLWYAPLARRIARQQAVSTGVRTGRTVTLWEGGAEMVEYRPATR